MSAVQTTTAASIDAPSSQDGHGRSRRNRQPRQRNDAQETPDSSGPEGAASGRRRAQGGRGRGGSLAMRPSTLPPRPSRPSAEPATAQSSNENPQRSEAGPSRGQRSRGQSSTAAQNTRMVNGRAFGGRLTSGKTADDPAAALQADAVEFVPGQPLITNQRSQQRPVNAPRKRRSSKSTAPDILTRTHEDIEHGQYECAICTSEVQRNSKVWSCHTCWTVFHLTCIKKWAGNEGSAAARRQSLDNGETPPPRQWRCPGCNLPKDEQPKSYTCWCGKETDPRPPIGIPPHSCGNTCSKDRVRKCPHPCQLTCHAGPCPPCTYMGPTQVCFCGKNESTRKCSDTDYENGWSCEEICGDVMPCGLHTCPRPCHEGLCGACEEEIDARCYCGQDQTRIPCHAQGDPKDSHRRDDSDLTGTIEEWTGTFDCLHECNRPFVCGQHQCDKTCHPQDADPAHCPRSPDLVTHCPCGKTQLSALLDEPRSTCTDPIPKCDKRCTKPLSCGHACIQLCHTGACLPCMQSMQISCVCGRVTSTTICHQGTVEKPQCMRVCRATLSCGRHACDERCCPGEKKASERLSTKKQRRPLGAAAPPPELVEAEHICTRVCGRPLKCGNHTCQELCHKGPCGSCREAIFDEVLCDCGRTRLDPPLPCGTRPPPCRFQCERRKTCGHPQVQHTCHPDSDRCPKCPFLVERRCMCGKKVLKNQPCWLQDCGCGQICGKKLRCGSHFCRKLCHKDGECEDADGKTCQQPCGKPKQTCGHPDENVCHAPYACKEDKPCMSKIFITCECQAQKQEARCGASKSSEGNQSKTLPCNDECTRLERNRRLAVALNIDQSSHVDGGDHIPYSEETLNLFAQHQQWCQNQEREYRVFADSPDEKRMRFKPMSAGQRSFLHALADDFGFDSESLDPEPHRHVLLLKTPRFVSAPSKTLAESLRVRNSQRALQIRPPTAADKPPATAPESTAPFNAFVIASPRFGLTADELRAALALADPPFPPDALDASFLPSADVVLRPRAHTGLVALKPRLAAAMAVAGLGAVRLCAVDASGNVVRREADAVSDGWSKVAAKGAAAPRRAVAGAARASRNGFAALAGGGGEGKVTFAKRKVAKAVEVEVVDDWEAEMEAEEKRRDIVGGGRVAASSGYADGAGDTGNEGDGVEVVVAGEQGGERAGPEEVDGLKDGDEKASPEEMDGANESEAEVTDADVPAPLESAE